MTGFKLKFYLMAFTLSCEIYPMLCSYQKPTGERHIRKGKKRRKVKQDASEQPSVRSSLSPSPHLHSFIHLSSQFHYAFILLPSIIHHLRSFFCLPFFFLYRLVVWYFRNTPCWSVPGYSLWENQDHTWHPPTIPCLPSTPGSIMCLALRRCIISIGEGIDTAPNPTLRCLDIFSFPSLQTTFPHLSNSVCWRSSCRSPSQHDLELCTRTI